LTFTHISKTIKIYLTRSSDTDDHFGAYFTFLKGGVKTFSVLSTSLERLIEVSEIPILVKLNTFETEIKRQLNYFANYPVTLLYIDIDQNLYGINSLTFEEIDHLFISDPRVMKIINSLAEKIIT
jgi:hypothetical protein